MNTKGFRRMLVGEKMPDKEDPTYRERYRRDVSAGRKFAHVMKLDKLAADIQRFADRHRTAFLAIIFTFVIGSFAWNIYRLMVVYERKPSQRTATEMQDSLLRKRHKAIGNTYVPPIKEKRQ